MLCPASLDPVLRRPKDRQAEKHLVRVCKRLRHYTLLLSSQGQMLAGSRSLDLTVPSCKQCDLDQHCCSAQSHPLAPAALPHAPVTKLAASIGSQCRAVYWRLLARPPAQLCMRLARCCAIHSCSEAATARVWSGAGAPWEPPWQQPYSQGAGRRTCSLKPSAPAPWCPAKHPCCMHPPGLQCSMQCTQHEQCLHSTHTACTARAAGAAHLYPALQFGLWF